MLWFVVSQDPRAEAPVVRDAAARLRSVLASWSPHGWFTPPPAPPAPPSFVQVTRRFARSAQSGPRDALHRDRRTPDFVYRLSYALRSCAFANWPRRRRLQERVELAAKTHRSPTIGRIFLGVIARVESPAVARGAPDSSDG